MKTIALTLSDRFLVSKPNVPAYARDLLLVLLGSYLVALFAQIRVPLGWTPVPITGQTFAVLLVGAVLGSKRGALSICAYLAQGALGLPFFAGGLGGIAYLLGPTGGYLVGFVGAAFVVGWLAERGWDRNFLKSLGAFILGTAVIYAVGLTWLSQYAGFENAVTFGLLPFLPGAGLKILLAAGALPFAWRWIKD